MIGLLPLLRFPRLRRNRPVSAPRIDGETSNPPAAPVEPPWEHRPPEPYFRADKCGWCGNPIPDKYADGEFCRAACQANWMRETYGPTYGPVPPPVIGCERPPSPLRLVPDAPPEPAWMARWTGWEVAKAEAVVAPRKAPAAEEETAA